jgi:hypothetical protein
MPRAAQKPAAERVVDRREAEPQQARGLDT